MQAARFNGDGMILFSTEPIPEAIRAELERDHDAVILEDVSLGEVPERGGYLCVAVDDPTRFVVVEHKEEAQAFGCVPTGKPYGFIRHGKDWGRYLSIAKEFLAIASRTDETDTDEAWDSVMANITRAIMIPPTAIEPRPRSTRRRLIGRINPALRFCLSLQSARRNKRLEDNNVG
jgi:hypothetical protein